MIFSERAGFQVTTCCSRITKPKLKRFSAGRSTLRGIRNKVKPFWTSSPYCHCNFTVLEERYGKDLEEWTEALLQMDYNNPAHRTIMDMEGLKRWVRPQLAGYKPLFEAVEAVGYFTASA